MLDLEKARGILRWREIHEVVKTVGSAGVFIAVVALVLTVRHEIPKIRTEVLPNMTKQLVDATKEEGRQTRKMIETVASDLSKKVDDRADNLQTALLGAVDRTEHDANNRIADVVSLAKENLGKVTTTLAGAQRSVDKVASLAVPLRKTLKLANASVAKIDSGIVDPLTDCKDNPSCFTNRWAGISWDAESFLRTIAKETPRISASLKENADASEKVLSNVADITSDVHEFTDKFVHPPKKKWYQHVEDWFLGLAKLTIYAFK